MYSIRKITLLILSIFIISCATEEPSNNDEVNNSCNFDSALLTLEVSNITITSATLNGTVNINNCDNDSGSQQGFVYSTMTQPTLNDTQINVNGTNISTQITNLLPYTTYYVRTFIKNDSGEFYGNEIIFDNNPVYLDDNGVTIKAKDWAEVGNIGKVNDIFYEIVGNIAELMENNQNLTLVCTSRITNMFWLFKDTTFNQNISSWDVSNVTSMGGMFLNNPVFNQDISAWDVGNVTDMTSMFYRCSAFNQYIGSWNVSKVTNMYFMFFETSFNQDIGNWDVSSVTNMEGMFNSSAFNKYIGNWNVSNVTNMRGMFVYGSAFNQDISSWDVSNVTNMASMFGGNSTFGTPAFNQDIGSWDVGNVTDMNGMFYSNSAFNQDIGEWDVSNATNMSAMFGYNSAFNQDISAWDVSNVTDMAAMFRNNSGFNQDISAWNVINVTNCIKFSDFTPSWSLPKPTFTNCDPN